MGGTTVERLRLILAVFVLGLFEVDAFRDDARRRLRLPAGETLVDATRDVAHRVRRDLRALTVTSPISGAATGLFTPAVGRDSPTVWGLIGFLLNYVPTIGPLVAVVPPALYALVQFGEPRRTVLLLAGLGAIQFVIGTCVDPKIEGVRSFACGSG